MIVVLLAAGYGKRLGCLDLPKPLIPLEGKPLLAHVLERVFSVNPNRVLVVTGHGHEKLEKFLRKCSVEIVRNPTPWRENGASLLCAQSLVRERFILAMSDHIVDPIFYRKASQCKGFGLCVDRTPALRCQQNDATRVWVEKDFVTKIGKDLSEWNALDTGVFALTPKIFDVLHELSTERSFTITQAIQRLIAQGHVVHALDLSGKFWADIDTPEDLREIESLL
ncbi:MAG: NTP transferase domain-containing protein [Candidatus Bipolaricaulota bacterium]|nr:NTP transferase domain-containing protein [Candidatus Bipolaricaulota bacterium]